ncbi:MAG: hypothetical protein KGK05_01860 [Xanthomonadaceae bacterium]|nr:hypothetical protein [Xanthomonadaceae bacterium]
MKHQFLAVACASAVAAFGAGQLAHAETLLMKRVREERGMHAPHRGMTMNQVERRFGAPMRKLSPAGGDAARHPVINRWEYPNYIVYFERSIVIDSVAVHAEPGEIGPKSQ